MSFGSGIFKGLNSLEIDRGYLQVKFRNKKKKNDKVQN